ncbi:MAG: choice-of-anchor S family protein [Candidatus Heimdallarchaeota archaeon]
MKKITIFTFIMIALTFSVPFLPVQGVLSVGDEFEFEVKKAYGNFNYVDNTVTVTGQTDQFRVGDTALDKGDKIDVQVDAIGASSVDYSITDSSAVLLADISSSSFLFALSMLYYSVYPFLMLGISSASVTDLDVSKGVSLGDAFYVAPPSIVWDDIYDSYNDVAQWSDLFSAFESDEGNVTTTTKATWYDGGETIAFEIDITGRYEIAAETTGLGIIHSLRFDYNVSNYVLLGYDMFTLISGDYQGINTNFAMTVQVTESSYTRKIGAPFLIIGLASILSVSVMVLLRKRKK